MNIFTATMKAKKTQFVLLLLVVAMGAGLIMFRNGGLNSNTKINVSLDEIKSVDLVDHYPTTQKEVVELFSKITKEFYKITKELLSLLLIRRKFFLPRNSPGNKMTKTTMRYYYFSIS